MTNNVGTVNGIKEYLDMYIAGQEEAKDVLATAGFLHYSRNAYKMAVELEDQVYLRPSNTLILGPTGCGKTYMVQTLAECLGMHFMEINANALSEEGWKGSSITETLEGEIKGKTEAEIFNLQYGIVFIDEFDKLCVGNEQQRAHNLGVQNSLLKVIEGTTLKLGNEATEISTHNMLFVIGGNFEHMRVAQEKSTKPSIGFNNAPSAPVKTQSKHAELIAAGMSRELAGRISMITEVYNLNKDNLREILTKSKESVLEQYKELYRVVYGKELRLTRAEVTEIVDKCHSLGIGARGLQTALDEFMVKRIKRQRLDLDNLWYPDYS